MAREKNLILDKKLKNEIAKEMIYPYYFVDRALQVGFNITPDSHRINHAVYISTIESKHSKN